MQAILPFPDISPDIFSVPLGPVTLTLRWYALAYIAGLVLAWRWVVTMMKRPALWRDGVPPMAAKQVEEVLTWVILGVVLGGRLGYVMFYQPGYYLAHPGEILMIWQGGMSFHGGFLGVVVAGLLYCHRHGLAAISVGDAFAVTAPIGLLLGRLANFINAELWGRPSDLPWAVVFPGPHAAACPSGWTGECARHPSQLYEAGLEGLVLGLVLAWLAYRRGWLGTPGALTGVFLMGYGAARAFVEIFRQADPQFITAANPEGYRVFLGAGWGLTTGQLLSLPMLAIGLWLVIRARRRA